MKAQFRTTLSVRRTPRGTWELRTMLVFDSEVLNARITVPRGFESDFASVPRLPLAYWLFGGVADEAAVIHDFAYSTGMVTRAMADKVFLEALEACGTAAWRRWPMFWGVRLFGGSRFAAKQAAA